MSATARTTARPTARPINRQTAAAAAWRRLDDAAAAAADWIVDAAAPLVLRVVDAGRRVLDAWAQALADEIAHNRRAAERQTAAARPRARRSTPPACSKN